MTEETIRAIIETDHFDSTKIKKILEQHESEMVACLEWYSKLTPVQKCTVHPPAGSGGSTGLYQLSFKDLLTLFKNRNK